MMVLLLNLGASAQEYDSTYTAADGTIGQAKFDYYYDIDHLMVKNGAFEFVSNKTDSTWASTFEEVSVSGNYTENKKSKDWRYEITRREIAIRGISADSIDYDLRTYETSINGHYTNGIPTGSWTMLTTLKHKGHPLQTYDSTHVSFKKGYADGPFYHVGTDANGDPVLVQGQFEKGVFTGEWRFEYILDGQIMNESRLYELGILKSVSITTLSGEAPITRSTSMPLSVKASEALRKTDRSDLISPPTSLEFNDGYPQSSIYVSIQKSGNDILNQLQKSLLRFDPDILDKQQVIYGAVRVFHPFSEDEKRLVTQWNDVEDAFRDKVALVKEHEIRDFGNSQDSIAVVALKWIERQENLMERLNIVGQLLLSRDLENYYRDGLLLKNAIAILDSDTIRYNEQKQVVNYPTSAASKETLLTYLVANFQSRMRVADQIDRDLSRLKSTSSLKEELASLPELISLERNRVDSLYELAYSGSTKKVLTHVSNKFLIQDVHPAIARFEASEESDAKKSLGDSILINLNTLNRVHRTTLKIEQRSHFIDSLFTVYVFDAFTFTDMPTTVKKKLHDQVMEMIDALTTKAISAEELKVCLDLLEEVYDVQGTLIYLRDQNTKALEKSLGRAESLDDKLKLLHEAF